MSIRHVTGIGFLVILSSGASAQVTGTVKLDGPAPKMQVINFAGVPECAVMHPNGLQDETVVLGNGGGLANVVIYVQAEQGQELGGEVPKQPAVLNQDGCTYTPHVVAMMIGQPLKVTNSDPFLHNVRGDTKTNPSFNFALLNNREKTVTGIRVAETFKVKCDVHPWMRAYIVALPHPFFWGF